MSKLPYSRTVLVTLTRNDRFPATRGFGTPLMLTSVAVNGQVDASHRTKSYASMDEVAADWETTTDFYKAALEAFSQEPRPLQIKAGYYVLDSTPVKAELIAQLDLIHDADPDFYFVTIDAPLRDTAHLDGLVEWIEAKNKFAIIDSNAVGTQDPANTTVIAARFKGTVERTAVFYHTDAAEWGAMALAAKLSSRNFDNSNSAYTAKYKRMKGVAPLNLASSKITAITGFVPAVGQSEDAGHMANCQIDIGGQDFVAEGSTLTPNVFIDEIHATDWIIARTEEQALGILLNNARVPFTDQGMEMLASAARTVMQMATRAGLVATDLDPLTGLYAPAVEYNVPSVFDVPESQRKSRIAPNIEVKFRYAGAVHYTTINYQMTF